MIANHIHDALSQVKKLQAFILEKRLFKGYSGRARIICGLVALLGAFILDSKYVPNTNFAHLLGWSAVLSVGIVLNYGSLCYWFLFNREVRRNPSMLTPALDALPALGIGAIFTFTFLFWGHYHMMMGMWMALYGVAQTAYRSSLPIGIYYIGLFYALCGALHLSLGTFGATIEYTMFSNPWPMGIVFFIGEFIGGYVLINYKYKDEMEKRQQNEE